VTHDLIGWLAKSGEIHAFAEGVVDLLQNPARARAMGQAARDYVAENASWPKAAERCERIFESLRARVT
jgi:glycosyltransferase involved in cell wall biosynthesis